MEILKYSFRTGQLIDISRITHYRHFDGTGQTFESGFDLVVLVFSFHLDVQVALGSVGEGLEEVEK